MNYQKYKNIITSKLLAFALLLGLTAVFAQAAVTVHIKPEGPGSVSKTSSTPFITISQVNEESETLTAVPDSGAVFSHWELSSPNLKYWSPAQGGSTSTVITVYSTVDDVNYDITAVFENAPVNVTVTSLASDGVTPVGTPYPGHGVNAIATGTELEASVNSPYYGNTGIRYRCTGFSGTGDFLTSGVSTNTTATITQDSTITWAWDTEYLLTLQTSHGGSGSSIDFAPSGSDWIKEGTTVYLTAQPDLGYNFVRWDNPGGPVDGLTSPSVSFSMTNTETITAIFQSYPELDVKVTSLDEDGANVDGYTFISGNEGLNTYNDFISISVDPTVIKSTSFVREHCLGYTSTGGNITPASIVNSEISSIPSFSITNTTTIDLDWVREYRVSLGVAGDDTNGFDVSYVSYSPARTYTLPPWFRAGDTVTISATPLIEGYVFLKWNSTTFGIDQYSPTNTFVVTGGASFEASFASEDLDSDLDGMPDTWEAAYGLNEKDPSNAFEDPDNDGLSNLQEYLISEVLLAAGTVSQDISPINADSDGDGMDDGYEYNHILVVGASTPVGESQNALAVISTEGAYGPNGNPDEDYHWDTTTGYEDTTRGLLNIEEYYGPDGVAPYNFVTVNDTSLSTEPIIQAQVNTLDNYDTSFSDTTDSETAGTTTYGDGFDDGFEYTWDQWQGGNGGQNVGDPMNHIIPDRFGVAANPVAVVNADMNNDGNQDLVVASFGQEMVSMLIGDGLSGFTVPVTYSLDSNNQPLDLVVNDFNADGNMDVVTANTNGTYSVLFGTGDASDMFPSTNIITYLLDTSLIKVDSEDLDGVNGPDLVFADANSRIHVALNNGDGTFATTVHNLGAIPSDIKLAPLYSDSASAVYDLAVTLDNDTIEIFSNDGSGVFTSSDVISLPASSAPGAFDVADFDGNGYVDIAVACTGDGYVRVYLNVNGTGTFSISDTFLVQLGADFVDLAAADFTTYGNTDPSVNQAIDIAIVSYGLDSVFLYANNGLGEFGPHSTFSTSVGPMCVLFAEMRAGTPTYLDMIIAESNADSLAEYQNDGNGTFAYYAQFDVSDRSVDRRFNPAEIHSENSGSGRADYDLVYYIETGRAVYWLLDSLEYNAWNDAGQTIGNYYIPTIVGGSSTARRSTHPFLWDADGDGLPDGWELAYGYDPWTVATVGGVSDADDNPDGDWYAAGTDAGGNAIKHKEVYDEFGFNPQTGWFYADTTDGVGDNTAQYSNIQELYGSSDLPAIIPNDPNDGGTCPISIDADGDGVWDGWELYVGMDPVNADDATEQWDTLNAYWWGGDNDGLVNVDEFNSYATSTNISSALTPVDGWYNKTYPTDPWDWDTDYDQVIDGVEAMHFNFAAAVNGGGLCPTAVDTDGDRIPDAWEANYPGSGNATNWVGGMNGTAHDAYLDYDNDGLLNYQEYFTCANYAWRYDVWTNTVASSAYDPYDFFADSRSVASGGDGYGYGRMPYSWDPSYYLNPPDNTVNLRFQLANELIAWEDLLVPYFPGTRPDSDDSDVDGMNDYWEVFHGLNPIYGFYDLVADSDVIEGLPPYSSWHSVRDYNATPWIVGYPKLDVDQDGIVNYEEEIFVNAVPYHHTDPSPLWMTDISADLSYVNLYYNTGTFFSNSEWYWGDSSYGGNLDLSNVDLVGVYTNSSVVVGSDNDVINLEAIAPRYAYSFEINEGYDTDNDGISDYNELNDTTVSAGITDPLDNMSPNINRALYLNGEAYTATPMNYGWGYPDFRTYSVETWVRPEELPTAEKQIILQRAGYLSNADQFNPNIFGWRRNFELGLTEDGKPYVLFDTPVGDTISSVANFAIETNAWTHLAGSYEGYYDTSKQWIGKLNLYVNGTLVKSTPASTMPANSYEGGDVEELGAMTFMVGNGKQEADPDDYFFKGWVDNVRAWGVAQDQETLQSVMNTTFDREQASTYATNEATRLLFSYSFNDLPDPDIDNISPDGFDALVGYPANYTAIPFWRAMTDRSRVYTDYKYLPWIDNQSLHYPRPVASDTVIASDQYGSSSVIPENYPNPSDPYGFKYLTGTVLENTQDPEYGTSFDPSYEWMIHPDPLANTPVAADMLPMLYARTTESVPMWDNTASRELDSDGDGLPDIWEIAMGLDPYDATGDNGAYGDSDGDGLSNIYEYEAGTSPLEYASTTNNVPDFFAWGNNLTGALDHDYRTFGELLTDHDMMEDEWEIQNGLSPYRFDAFEDPDGDGWSNYAEFRYGSNPQSAAEIPVPEMFFKVYYDGLDGRIPFDGNTTIKLLFYTDKASTADGMMSFVVDASGASQGSTSGNIGTLNTPVVPSSISVNGGVVRDSTADGRLLNASGTEVGTVDYYTGVYSIDSSVSVTSLTYSYGGVYGFPVYGSVSNVFIGTGNTKEGLNYVFAFADIDGNDAWDPDTEPAGVADNGPVMLNGDAPGRIEISLKDYAPGFGRFAWSQFDSAVGYRVNVSKDAYQLFSTEVEAKKYFISENDFMEFYGNAVPEGTISWTVDLLDQSGIYSNNYASGSFDISYPSYLEVPSIEYPSTGVKCSTYRNTFKWTNADKEATFYELQIATDDDFNNIVYSKSSYMPVEVQGVTQVTLPEIGSGFEWEQQTYYWRVRNKTAVAAGNWSSVESFRIDYETDALYTYSISGTNYYTGKAKTGNIVVEAYDNDSFSGVPFSVDIIENDPDPDLWPLNPYEYTLPGLSAGTYYVRSFLDQNGNYIKDDFETYGYVADSADLYTVKPIALSTFTGNVAGQNIYTVVADTDDDMLADDWEWSYLGTLDIMGAGEVGGFTDYDGNGVNDFQAYAWSALNMSPVDGATAGADGVPYNLKLDFGLSIVDEINLAFQDIYFDKDGKVYLVWDGLGGSANIATREALDSMALEVTAGDSTVDFTLQYSTDMVNWTDLETGANSEYYPTTDAIIYQGDLPVHKNGDSTEPVFYRFKVNF